MFAKLVLSFSNLLTRCIIHSMIHRVNNLHKQVCELRLRIFKNAWFRRFARQEESSDHLLVEAVARADNGLIDAELGGSVTKQQIAKPGKVGQVAIALLSSSNKAAEHFSYTGLPKANVIILKSRRKKLSKKQPKPY